MSFTFFMRMKDTPPADIYRILSCLDIGMNDLVADKPWRVGAAAAQVSGIAEPDFSGAASLVDAISSCNSLSTITFGVAQIVSMKADMTEADFSGKNLGSVDAIILTGFLPKCR